MDLSILFEDDCVVAVAKPSFMPSQNTPDPKRLSAEFVLAEQLGQPVWLVHRLDAETSGVLVFAKSKEIAAPLSASLANKQWTKVYMALCEAGDESIASKALTAEWEIRNHLKQSREKIGGRVVTANRETRSGGDRAITEFKLLGQNENHAAIEARPVTGRMHQIRTHLATHGWPIVGDRIYAASGQEPKALKFDLYDLNAPGLALHARRLCFPHPTESNRVIEVFAEFEPSFLRQAESLGLADFLT